jgi:predicted RND superfamily exporter protein
MKDDTKEVTFTEEQLAWATKESAKYMKALNKRLSEREGTESVFDPSEELQKWKDERAKGRAALKKSQEKFDRDSAE